MGKDSGDPPTLVTPLPPPAPAEASWRAKVHEVIFEADTPAGKAFDVALLWCILLSVLAVILESVPQVSRPFGPLLRAIEWGFTVLFTIEYVLRLMSVRRPLRYARSFFGMVDLLSILPTYLSFFVAGTHSLLVIRSLRLLRVFRILKLAQFVGAARTLRFALKASANKIIVFLGAVLAIVLIVGSLMYLVEGNEGGFTSIPVGIYWAIVTMTTVGYGDIVPTTDLGRFIASFLMIAGYGIIAVPTGIVSVELANVSRAEITTRNCNHCSAGAHEADAKFCRVCGERLE